MIRIKIINGDKSAEGWAMIDTGASQSIVDTKLITKLELKETGRPIMHSNSSVQNELITEYGATFYFPTLDVEGTFNVTPAIMSPIHHINDTYIAVLGRDFLSKCTFTYDGVTGQYSIELSA